MERREIETVLWNAERDKCRNDLAYLMIDVLGYLDLENELHRRLMRVLDTFPEGFLCLLPRGFRKSTIVTQGDSIRHILRDRNTTIGLGSFSLDLASTFVVGIKSHLEMNEKLKYLFPDVLYYDPMRESSKWTTTELLVKRDDPKIRENTVEAFSIESLPTGKHYKILKFDDIVTDRTVTTKDQIDKTKYQYNLASFLTMRDTLRHVCGTRYHYNDIYGDIEKLIKNKLLLWKLLKQACWTMDGDTAYPYLSKEKLLSIKQSIPTGLWSSQYLLNPIDEESATFKKEQIRYVEQYPNNLAVFTTTDLAISQEDKSDFSVILTAGIDDKNDLYVINIRRGKWLPNKFIDELFDVYQTYRPYKVSIETVAYQKAMVHFLDKEMLKRHIFIPIKELKRDSKQSKNARISSLQNRFERGKIFIWRNCLYTEELEEELLRFNPNVYSNRDDLLDSLSDIDTIGFEGSTPRVPEVNYLCSKFLDKCADMKKNSAQGNYTNFPIENKRTKYPYVKFKFN